MDRVTVYPAEIPLTEDVLEGQRAPYIGIGHLANLALEGSPAASGFGLTISGLQITVAPGAVYAMGQVDATAYGELPADTAPLMCQYLSASPTPLIASASASSYIYAVLSTVDTDAAVLPFYNAADPSQTFSGPSNSGEALPTRRRDVATIAIGAAIPPGAIPLWKVTADAATATAVKAPAAPFYPSMVAVASRIVAPYDAQLAAAMGGYPLNAVVADPVTAGVFWVSTVAANVSVPGAEGAGWQSLFDGYATQAWADGRFLQLDDTETQTVTGPVEFESDIHLKTSGGGATPQIYYDRNGIPAFSMGVDGNGNLFISRYSSTSEGTWLGEPVTVDGETGAITINSSIEVPDITAFTGKDALNAETAEGRYIKSVPASGSTNVRIVDVQNDASGNLIATRSDGTAESYAPVTTGTFANGFWVKTGNIRQIWWSNNTFAGDTVPFPLAFNAPPKVYIQQNLHLSQAPYWEMGFACPDNSLVTESNFSINTTLLYSNTGGTFGPPYDGVMLNFYAVGTVA